MKKQKFLVLDSGTLINFSTNSLLSVFEQLKESFDGEFLITNKIKSEVVDHPIKVKRFEWGALRIKQLIDREVVKIAEKGFVNGNEMKKRAKKLLEAANSSFFAKKRALHLIDQGEAEVIAVSRMLESQGHKVATVIDERTARVLCEKPENLEKLLKKKLHTHIQTTKSNFDLFKGCNIIRSTELAYIAYKKGFLHIKDKKVLEAVIYALKFGGVSISEKEAQMYKKMR